MDEKKNPGFSVNREYRSEYSLQEVIFCVLKQWRMILVLALAGALLGGVIGYKQAQPQLSFNVVTDTASLNSVELLNAKRADYDYVMEQIANGYLSNLSDEKQYYEGNIKLFIYSSDADCRTIANEVFNLSNDLSAKAELKELLGISQEDVTFDLVVQCETIDSNEVSLPANPVQNQQTNSQVIVIHHDEAILSCAVVSYKISCISENQIMPIRKYVEDWIGKQAAAISESEVNISVQIFDGEFVPCGANVLTEAKLQLSDMAAAAYADYAATLAKVSKNENKSYGGSATGIISLHNNPDGPTMTAFNKMKVISFAAVCAVLFAFIMMCCSIMKYLLSDSIRRVSTITDGYGINVIACVENERSGRGIDAMIRKAERKCEGKIHTSAAVAAKQLEKQNGNTVCLCETMKNTTTEKFINAIRKKMTKKVVNGMMNDDGPFFDTVCEEKSVVLVITKGETLNSEIRAVLNMCMTSEIRVAGAVLIEKGEY